MTDGDSGMSVVTNARTLLYAILLLTALLSLGHPTAYFMFV
jgi:hypothetical protein